MLPTGRKFRQNRWNFNVPDGKKNIDLTDGGFSGGNFYELNLILSVNLAAGIYHFNFFYKLFPLE